MQCIRTKGCRGISTSTLGLLQKPRTRFEKTKHLQVLGKVPMEMVHALDERTAMRAGAISKRNDPISAIVVRHDISPDTELITTMCRACALGEYDRGIWGVFRDCISTTLSSLSAVDSGLILKMLVLHAGNSKEAMEWELLVQKLLLHITRSTPDTLGIFTCLYMLQSLSVFKITGRQRSAIVNLCRRIFVDRVSALPMPLIVALAQASESAPREMCHSLIDRSITLLRSPSAGFEIDGLFGLVSAAGKMANLPSADLARILHACKPVLLSDDDHLLEGFSLEQLSGTANVFSKLGPAIESGHVDVFSKIGIELSKCSESEWSPRSYAVVLSAFGTAGVNVADLMDVLRNSVEKKVAINLSGRQVAMAVHGLVRLGEGEFPYTFGRVAGVIAELDMHSLSKILGALLDGRYVEERNACACKMIDLITNSGISDYFSVLVILGKLSKLPANALVDHHKLVQSAVACVTTHMHRFPDSFTHVIQILVDAGDKPDEGGFKPLAETAIINHLTTPISLSDLSKLVFALSQFKIILSGAQAESIRSTVSRQAPAGLQHLSFRQLSRLAAGLVKCGICDEDIIGAINECLDKKR